MTKKKIIVILGPTSSGKSALAVKVAKKFGGEIISADSRQVYQGFNLSSGKITKKEMMGIRHHLLDVISPKKTFTAANYKTLGQKIISQIIKKGKVPIICGGTGFYIDTLINDYNLPKIKPNPKLRKKLEQRTGEELMIELEKKDPTRASIIDPKNKRRVIRALEIIYQTKKPIEPVRPKSKYRTLKIGIVISDQKLRTRIKERIEKRIRQGMIKEIQKLHNQGISWQRLDYFGLEYRWISRYLRGIINKDEMLENLNQDTRRFAKRQITWFKRDKNIIWIKNESGVETKVTNFLK